MPPTGADLDDGRTSRSPRILLQSNGGQPGSQPFAPATAEPIGDLRGARPSPPLRRRRPVANRLRGVRGAGRARRQVPAQPVPDGAAAAANAGPRGVTVAGEVKNYVPVTDEMLRNPDPGDWLMARRNYQGWSYSPLTQITRDNVKDLRLAWVWAMNEGGANQPTPLVHNGIIYLDQHRQHRPGARRAGPAS